MDVPTLDAATMAQPGWAPATRSISDTLIGTRFGIYDVEAYCGAGAMARVYRARHRMLHRLCAIKVLNTDLIARSPDVVAAFLDEARAAAGLVHPHVVTIHTIGEDRGFHFIGMEFVEGRSLAHVIDSSRIDATRATKFLMHVSSAMAEAHRRGLVHRDIKPANVLVTASDIAKVADFGLARRVEGASNELESQGLAGTPQYMAPELFGGRPATSRSDVYSLGVTYFLLCTGRLPFEARSIPEMARRHTSTAPPELSDHCPAATESMARIVRRCLAKDPHARYEDAGALHDELHAAYVGLRSLESLLHEALLGSSARITRLDVDHFQVRIPVVEERTQDVVVECIPDRSTGDAIVRVFSICAPLDESYMRRALELNASLPFGAIAVEQHQGRPYFMMLDALTRSTCDPVELRASVLSIAKHADEVEHRLTGSDRH